jgi:tetrahydromethanopterin S-methyltransferase subunit G
LLEENNIKQKIHKVRRKMETLWEEKLQTDDEVLNVSMELDSLLNKLQWISSEESQKTPR